jgi:hypothetical protein
MIQLDSMAVTMPEVLGHPNRREFRGVLTTVDQPSQRSPSGAKGHLVVLTKKAAEAALPSLLGMALDYAPTLDRHDVRRKVGVITEAEIAGGNLEVAGYLFARDFPEIVEEIAKSANDPRKRTDSLRAGNVRGNTMHAAVACDVKTSLQTAANQIRHLTAALKRSPRNKEKHLAETHATISAAISICAKNAGLGLSYEVTNVQLADSRAHIWMLEKVTFTGAAILRREKAAYQNTWIELSS